MRHQQLLQKIIGIALIMMFLVGCGTSTTLPVPETSTAIPEAKSPTPEPINTPTPTPIPTPHPNVSFDSNVGAEFTGVTISFQHPREWQTGYFSDSGVYGWVIADVDPNKAFWSKNQTGNEIVILLMGGAEADSDSDPSKLLKQLGKGAPNADINEVKENDKYFAYVLNSGEFRAAAIIQQKTFSLFGSYPQEKESDVQNGIETILHSLLWHDANSENFSDKTIWGSRNEGLLINGSNSDGYIPMASMSTWTIEGKTDQKIKILVDPDAPEEANLMLNILNEDGKSIFSAGEIAFSGNYESEKISLPASGSYLIQVYPSLDSQWYGWYKIELK